MQPLEIIKRKGRNKRLYSQFQINLNPDTNQLESADSKLLTTEEKGEAQQTKRVHEEDKDGAESQEWTSAIPFNQYPQALRDTPKPLLKEQPKEFTVDFYIQLNQLYERDDLLRLLELLRGSRAFDSSKLRSRLAKSLSQPCVLPPFDDSINNEKKVCCEVVRVRRLQIQTYVEEGRQLTVQMIALLVGSACAQMLLLCDKFPTSGQKMLEHRTVKPNIQNHANRVLLRCSDCFSQFADARRKSGEEGEQLAHKIAKLELKRVGDTHKVLAKYQQDTKATCRSLYEQNMNSGVFSAARDRHKGYLSGLNYDLLSQQEMLKRLFKARRARVAKRQQLKGMDLGRHCVDDPLQSVRSLLLIH